MNVFSIFKRDPNPELSTIGLMDFNRCFCSADFSSDNKRGFKKTIELAEGMLANLTSSDRDQAVINILGKWTPKTDLVKFKPLSRLNYLIWKLDPSPAVRAQIAPKVEEIYLKYLKQGAFSGFPSCNPELQYLTRLLSPEFRSSDKAYQTAREGLTTLLKSGEFHEYLFSYIGFSGFHAKLLQDEEVRSAACDSFNLLAVRGQLNYEAAYHRAKLFRVSAHLSSEQFIDSVKKGIRDLVTKNTGRWLGDLYDSSVSLSKQVTLSHLNELSLFLPWGDGRSGNIPASTREFVAEVRPFVKERIFDVLKNDVRGLYGRNDASEVSFTVQLFLGNSFYKNKETREVISAATINRMQNFRDFSWLNQKDPFPVWELLTKLPLDAKELLQQRPTLIKAGRKFVGRLLGEMEKRIECLQTLHSRGFKELDEVRGAELASNYAFPIIVLSRYFGLKEPELPQIPKHLLPYFQIKRSQLLCANDQCLASDQAAIVKAMQDAMSPIDRSLVGPLEKLAAKKGAPYKCLSPSALSLQAQRIRFLNDRSDLAARGNFNKKSEAEIKGLLASTYRSFALWSELDRKVDRRILIYLANELEAQH